MNLNEKTAFITGGSRGIGLAIAKKLASHGVNIVLVAKTVEPHPKLPGTIYTAAEEIEKIGGNCLPLKCDIRFEEEVGKSVEKTIEKFGSIDFCINNASAIALFQTDTTDMKRYDLMHDINTRGTFLVTKLCLPFLKKSNHAHILTLSPPIDR